MIMPDSVETKKRSSKPAASAHGKDKVLPAKPVTGEVDHAALAREIIAKFPKILAALGR
jgi:hypothetical protein